MQCLLDIAEVITIQRATPTKCPPRPGKPLTPTAVIPPRAPAERGMAWAKIVGAWHEAQLKWGRGMG